MSEIVDGTMNGPSIYCFLRLAKAIWATHALPLRSHLGQEYQVSMIVLEEVEEVFFVAYHQGTNGPMGL